MNSMNSSRSISISSIHDLNLVVLQRQDPTIKNILDSSVHTVVYMFDKKTRNWNRKDIEGTLFIYER
jgi:hypothetical protein